MKTINKAKFISVSLVILLVAALFIIIQPITKRNSSDNLHSFSVETFKTTEYGWGYKILKGNKMIIKQDIIPVIQNNIPFQSERDAKKTALLVVDKIKNRELPTLTMVELQENKINLGK